MRSYRSNEDQIGRDFDRAENYLSLVGLIIVILGGIAVSSVTRVFVLQKIRSIAVLKCVGARSAQIIAVYILQVVALGLAGSLLGVAIASAAVASIPYALGSSSSLLAQAHYGVTWSAAAQGIGIGVLVSLLFSVAPLLQVRFVKPSLLLRDEAVPRPPGLAGHRRARRCGCRSGRHHGLAGGVAQGRADCLRWLCGPGRRADAGRPRARRTGCAAREVAVVPAETRRPASVATRQSDARHPAGRRPRRLLHRRRPVAAGDAARRVLGSGVRRIAGHVPAGHPARPGRRRPRVPVRSRARRRATFSSFRSCAPA